MSDPIRIPVYSNGHDGAGQPCVGWVEITAETLAPFLAPALAHIAALEQVNLSQLAIIKDHVARKITPEQLIERQAALLTPAPVAADNPLPHDSRVVVTNPDAYKGADQPAGDDAAVEALRNLTFTDGKNEPLCLFSWKGDDRMHAACAVLAAIRRGVVPLPDDVPQIKALMQTCREWEAAVAELRAKLAWLQEQHDKHAANADLAEARVAELERESEQRVQGNAEARRTLLVELAAERAAHQERAARAAELSHDLAAMTERAESEYRIRVSMKAERDAACAEADALKREVAVLRQYGNKACTSMADEALAKGVEQ